MVTSHQGNRPVNGSELYATIDVSVQSPPQTIDREANRFPGKALLSGSAATLLRVH
jgi:hypothetical protein